MRQLLPKGTAFEEDIASMKRAVATIEDTNVRMQKAAKDQQIKDVEDRIDSGAIPEDEGRSLIVKIKDV